MEVTDIGNWALKYYLVGKGLIVTPYLAHLKIFAMQSPYGWHKYGSTGAEILQWRCRLQQLCVAICLVIISEDISDTNALTRNLGNLFGLVWWKAMTVSRSLALSWLRHGPTTRGYIGLRIMPSAYVRNQTIQK